MVFRPDAGIPILFRHTDGNSNYAPPFSFQRRQRLWYVMIYRLRYDLRSVWPDNLDGLAGVDGGYGKFRFCGCVAGVRFCLRPCRRL